MVLVRPRLIVTANMELVKRTVVLVTPAFNAAEVKTVVVAGSAKIPIPSV